jgi:hypothetical protein
LLEAQVRKFKRAMCSSLGKRGSGSSLTCYRWP